MSRVSSIGNSPNLCQSSSKNRPGCYLAKPFADSSGAELIQIKNLHKPYTKTFCRNLPSSWPTYTQGGLGQGGLFHLYWKTGKSGFVTEKKNAQIFITKSLKDLKIQNMAHFYAFFFWLDLLFATLSRSPPQMEVADPPTVKKNNNWVEHTFKSQTPKAHSNHTSHTRPSCVSLAMAQQDCEEEIWSEKTTTSGWLTSKRETNIFQCAPIPEFY